MNSPKRSARRTRSRSINRLRCMPSVEVFERREMLAANAFLQGVAFADTNGNNQLDPVDTRLAGVTIKLFNATGVNLLATTTTAADGSYLFTDSNVPGGLAPANYH